ncbi:MAG: AMP-binding protein [Gammaproteobacteria bacterium]|nr:AMP-binding protein [Gammaproteobacteria bacterium]
MNRDADRARSPGSSPSTAGAVLAAAAASDPGRPFLLFEGGMMTYGQVESQARDLAASLHRLGIERGDRLAILLPGCPEFIVAAFAAARLGIVVVPLNPRLPPLELRYRLRHSQAAVAVTPETFEGIDYLQFAEEVLEELPELGYVITVGEDDLWYDDQIYPFEDLVSAGRAKKCPQPELAADDQFALLYTAGTTGKPKGVELTHANLVQPARQTAAELGVTPADRVIGASDIFHAFSLGPAILGTAGAGASIVLQESFEGEEALDLIERHRATVHYGVPTHFLTELHAQRRMPRDLSSLRTGIVTGGPIGDLPLRHVREELCPNLQVAYSLTEAGSTLSMTRAGDPPEKQRFTVGRPLADVSVRVCDGDGSVLPVESLGELRVRGPGVMRGYYRQPDNTRRHFDADRFLHTGDMGIVDEDGYLHLVGRQGDVIIKAGFDVYPREVENRIATHPAVRDVVVVGLPDELLGEAVCACVHTIEGAMVSAEELRAWCRPSLATYKVPDRIQFFDDFPATAAGKVGRGELARLLRADILRRHG